MAVWQVSIEFIPIQWAEDNDYNSCSLYGEDGFDTTSAWKSYQPEKDLDRVFNKILPKKKSWCEDLSIWGNDKTNDIEVWVEDHVIFSIGFRLAFNDNINKLILALVDAAIELNCVFFIPEQKVIIQQNIFQLKKSVLKSNAAKYIKDPKAFLSGLNCEQ